MITFLIPTYNEKKNIYLFINTISNLNFNLKYNILFVDDNSDDGTLIELKKASNTHAAQADKITSALPMKSPMKKISGHCKAAAKRKFKVWPSAYASGWGVRCTRAGGPSKFGGGKKKK